MGYNYNIELITDSIEFRELNIVKYDGLANVITFELAFQSEIDNKHLIFIQEFKNGLKLYFRLGKISPILNKIELKERQGIGFIRFQRDLDTISLEELKIFINLANLILGPSLIKDNYTSQVDKKFIKQSFLSQTYGGSKASYLVYRHNGQVVVQNR